MNPYIIQSSSYLSTIYEAIIAKQEDVYKRQTHYFGKRIGKNIAAISVLYQLAETTFHEFVAEYLIRQMCIRDRLWAL